jgi:acyl-CoA synthetase (AMP-forming)/AMP-acid ligase II
MLYDRWRSRVRAYSDQLAVVDMGLQRRWTFKQLFDAAEADAKVDAGIHFPQGATADFILQVLRAWRNGRVVCPLEPGHARRELSGLILPKIAHLKTTSATTGKPRLIAFKAPQLIADSENIVQTMGLRPEWPNLGIISLAHSYGFSNLVLPLLLHGIPLILVGSALPEAVRAAAEGQQGVTLPAVPALWQAWLDADCIPANVRLAISAGAALPLALEQTVFQRCRIKIHNFYGSSECGGIAYDKTAVPRTDSSLVGTALDGVKLSVADDGCIEVRSPAVAETYWPQGSPELGKGVFRTNDVGEISSGSLYLRGRAGDQINVAGRKVLPEAIEAVLAEHPQVRACLAFGVPSNDAQRGETIVACVEGKTPQLGHSLKQFALTHLPAWQVPRDWWFVDTLDVNERGKLSRAEWRQRYLDQARGGSPLRISSARSTT